MKILNLANPQNSTVKFKIQSFPDGQHNVVIDKNSVEEIIPNINEPILHCHCEIKSRLNNWIDLEILACAAASLRGLGVNNLFLNVPYFLGSRSDRKFEEGGNNYLKDIVCPVINSLNFKWVKTLDPHSDVLEACLSGFKKTSNEEIVRYAISNICSFKEDVDNLVLVSPDAGAGKKIYKLAEAIKFTGNIITCSKDRDEIGKLTKCLVPLEIDTNGNSPYNHKGFVIIDDICDGGNTFVNIAKEIKKLDHFDGKIYLIVTHGIFSKGFKELSYYFDGIFCTNSYSDINSMNDIQKSDFIFKQLNIF